MTAPTFRCTADEPPQKAGGFYGAEQTFDSSEGLVLDEFTFQDVVHLEAMHERSYYLRVGDYVFTLHRARAKGSHWIARLEEGP